MNARIVATWGVIAGIFVSVISLQLATPHSDRIESDARPPRFETVAVVGGTTHGVVDIAGVPYIKSARWMAPLNLGDSQSPAISGEVEYFPRYFSALAGRNDTLYSSNYADLMRREVRADGHVWWPVTWNVERGAPVPSADPTNNFDYIHNIDISPTNERRVILLTRGGVRVLDDTAPPREVIYVPRLSEGHTVWPIVYDSDRVYWFEHDGTSGAIRSLDLRDAERPVLGHTVALPWRADRMSRVSGQLELHGNDLFYAGPGEVRVFRLSSDNSATDPLVRTRLVQVAEFPSERIVWDISADERSLWLLTRETVLEDPVLRRIDISDPGNPRTSAAALTVPIPYWIPPDYAWVNENHGLDLRLASWGGKVVLTNGFGGGLKTIDVTDPEHPGLAGELDLLGACAHLVVTAGRPFCIGATGPLEVVTGAGSEGSVQPAAPLEPLWSRTGAAFAGGILQFDSGSDSLKSFAVPDSEPPILVGDVDIHNGYDVHVVGNRAYVAAGEQGQQNEPDTLEIVDVSDTTPPRRIGSLELPIEGVVSMQASATHLYLTGYDGDLLVVDIGAQPPRLVGRLDDLPGIRPDIVLYGDTILAMTYDGFNRELIAVDVADPTQPRIRSRTPMLGYFHTSNNSIVSELDEDRGWLFLVGARSDSAPGLLVLDLADVDEPRWIAMHTDGYASDLAIVGDTIYAATEEGGVQVIRILPGWPNQALLPMVMR